MLIVIDTVEWLAVDSTRQVPRLEQTPTNVYLVSYKLVPLGLSLLIVIHSP